MSGGGVQLYMHTLRKRNKELSLYRRIKAVCVCVYTKHNYICHKTAIYYCYIDT